MYSKCGRTEEARRIFNYMPEKNGLSWTSMIDGYGKNGNPTEALELFNKMQIDYEIKPNYVTEEEEGGKEEELGKWVRLGGLEDDADDDSAVIGDGGRLCLNGRDGITLPLSREWKNRRR
ncbi:pentatricopeptide repeat-containing protein At1g28690, mitochondrial-like [Macadamia integrifolia]|uniref:pentatricopeptide repeat-containing protein At1g28690, mitochondrial-like n=1 Tax=Macadamia integrifolia TaxID=60698 RepID=UPI001C4E5AAC|nr:pentatricopeptide repeat-containing protein At1g28690, mitochondrial-like [Macadamia integrifolia]XP_042490454.1 pentatricopeptide repeat-containing protein At1g28690, mitochondrial-like [Macadamia integrifolia]